MEGCCVSAAYCQGLEAGTVQDNGLVNLFPPFSARLPQPLPLPQP